MFAVMKFRQSFRNVFPLVTAKKKLSFNDDDLSTDGDFEDENDAQGKKTKAPSTKARKNVKNRCENDSSNVHENLSLPGQSGACGKLMLCMEKLEKLSKRLEGISDDKMQTSHQSLEKLQQVN